MSRYTPGPWKAGNNGHNGVIYIMAGEDILCEVFDDDRLVPLPDEANARLIAAAPDLLEALTTFVSQYVALVESGDAGCWDVEAEPKVIAARAAIAKATATGSSHE